MKYIVEKNLDLVYHDPETGLPRLVMGNYTSDILSVEGARGQESWEDGKEVEVSADRSHEEGKAIDYVYSVLKKINELELTGPLALPLRNFMNRWNHFAAQHQPKYISDKLKAQELLSHFVKLYRDEEPNDENESISLRRSMLLSLISTLYQNSLITP